MKLKFMKQFVEIRNLRLIVLLLLLFLPTTYLI